MKQRIEEYYEVANRNLIGVTEIKNRGELYRLFEEKPLTKKSQREKFMWFVDQIISYDIEPRTSYHMINVKLIEKDKINFNFLEELKLDKRKNKSEQKYKNFFLTSKLINPNLYQCWNNKGVYLIFNETKSLYYIGSTVTSFYERLSHYFWNEPSMREVTELLNQKDTFIDFLYVAKENDSEEFIRNLEKNYMILYEKQGTVLNKKQPCNARSINVRL